MNITQEGEDQAKAIIHIDKDQLLKDCLVTLNEIPNTKLTSGKYKDSYHLASIINQILKS